MPVLLRGEIHIGVPHGFPRWHPNAVSKPIRQTEVGRALQVLQDSLRCHDAQPIVRI